MHIYNLDDNIDYKSMNTQNLAAELILNKPFIEESEFFNTSENYTINEINKELYKQQQIFLIYQQNLFNKVGKNKFLKALAVAIMPNDNIGNVELNTLNYDLLKLYYSNNEISTLFKSYLNKYPLSFATINFLENFGVNETITLLNNIGYKLKFNEMEFIDKFKVGYNFHQDYTLMSTQDLINLLMTKAPQHYEIIFDNNNKFESIRTLSDIEYEENVKQYQQFQKYLFEDIKEQWKIVEVITALNNNKNFNFENFDFGTINAQFNSDEIANLYVNKIQNDKDKLDMQFCVINFDIDTIKEIFNQLEISSLTQYQQNLLTTKFTEIQINDLLKNIQYNNVCKNVIEYQKQLCNDYENFNTNKIKEILQTLNKVEIIKDLYKTAISTLKENYSDVEPNILKRYINDLLNDNDKKWLQENCSSQEYQNILSGNDVKYTQYYLKSLDELKNIINPPKLNNSLNNSNFKYK